MKLPIIYKVASTGKIQQWEIEVEKNKYRTISGQVGGKLVISEWTTCQGKNIGRSNQTTPETQALNEATAKRKKKLEKDYSETVKKAKTSDFLQPMLAKIFEDYADSLEYPVYIQPKLDGIRCENLETGLLTRNGKSILSCPHIHGDESVFTYMNTVNITALDGELYNHTLKEDFNKITSLVKKLKPSDEDIEESKKLIQYWIYDCIVPNTKFSKRNALLKTLPNNKYWVLVPTYKCNNRNEIDTYYEKFIEEGFEGAIIRIDDVYEHKRSKFLLKRKEFQDAEFPILNIIEGVGNRSGMAGYIETKTKEGKPFKSNIKGDRDFLKDLLINKQDYIGKTVTIKYFKLTPDLIPRFPVAIKIAREVYE